MWCVFGRRGQPRKRGVADGSEMVVRGCGGSIGVEMCRGWTLRSEGNILLPQFCGVHLRLHAAAVSASVALVGVLAYKVEDELEHAEALDVQLDAAAAQAQHQAEEVVHGMTL